MISYDPGEVLIKEAQYDNWIYFLMSGKVGIQKQGEIIAVLKRMGDLFGEIGIIDGSPRSASIVAHKPHPVLCNRRLIFKVQDQELKSILSSDIRNRHD